MIIELNTKNKRMVVSLKEATKEPEEDYSEFLQTEDSLGSLGELFKDKFKNLK
jgi:small subunit ribosomal protein S1